MREVYPGIFIITEKGGLGGLKPGVNIYVITGKNGLIFDAGYGTSWDIARFTREYRSILSICAARKSPCSITRIVPSHIHPDHFSGLSRIRKHFGVSVLLTENMARLAASREAYMASYDSESLFHDTPPNPLYRKFISPLVKKGGDLLYSFFYGINFMGDPDVIIDENCAIDINGEEWRIFPAPGHAGEHISLYDPARGLLFAGDNVLRSVTPWLGPPKSDLDAYLDSLRAMLTLPKLEVIFAAHGSPVVEPRKRIQELIDWRIDRLDHVLAIVCKYGTGGVSMRTVVEELYPGLNPVKRIMARGWVELSLRALEDRKKIVSRIHRGKRLFLPV